MVIITAERKNEPRPRCSVRYLHLIPRIEKPKGGVILQKGKRVEEDARRPAHQGNGVIAIRRRRDLRRFFQGHGR